MMLLASLCCLNGCGNPDPAAEVAAERNKTNIQKVANAYVLFSALNRNRGPESKEELVGFVKNKSSIDRNLKLMGIDRDGFEDRFISEVDHQEFKIRWKLRINPAGTVAVPLVFEKTGVDDVRRVALSDSRILEVDSVKKYKDLMAGKFSKGDAGADVPPTEFN